MVLSNAERQKRYRERLRAAARGDDLGQRAREAIDEALIAIWEWGRTQSDYSDFDEFASLEGWLGWAADPKLAGKAGVAGQVANILSDWRDEMPSDKRPLLDRAAEIVAAAQLQHVPTGKPKR